MKHVILMGFMGCGKSSVGVRLSYKLQKAFLDTDNLIEKMEGMPISNIFDTYGEAYFREKETEVLATLKQEKADRIISLGGGTPLREENRSILKELGTVVYLKVSADTVYERLKGDTTRPLLQGENPKQKIEQLLEQRSGIYESVADVIICGDGKTHEEVISEIMEAVQ